MPGSLLASEGLKRHIINIGKQEVAADGCACPSWCHETLNHDTAGISKCTSHLWAPKALVICQIVSSLPNDKPPKKQQQPRSETFQIVHSHDMPMVAPPREVDRTSLKLFSTKSLCCHRCGVDDAMHSKYHRFRMNYFVEHCWANCVGDAKRKNTRGIEFFMQFCASDWKSMKQQFSLSAFLPLSPILQFNTCLQF